MVLLTLNNVFVEAEHGSRCNSDIDCMESHNRCDVGNSYKCVCQPFYRHDGIRCRRKYVKLSCNAVDHLIHLPSLRECLLSKSDDEFYKVLHEF